MIRRDNSQDAEKGRFYSNFWIEVAMGKENTPGALAALTDDDVEMMDPTNMADIGDGVAGAGLADLADFIPPVQEADIIPPVQEAKPARSKATEKKQESPRSLSSFADLASIEALMKNSADMGDETEVDLAADEAEDLDVPLTSDYTFDESAEEEEAASDEFEDFDEFDEDEEEEEGWGGGRKPKQTKPQKQRREPRRGF